MPGTKEIVSRIQSVKNTKKITYAMKLVSATKLRKSQEAVELARDYNNSLANLLARLASDNSDLGEAHPFLEKRTEKNIALIIIGGSRGLCGAYNSNINRAVDKFYQEHSNQKIDTFIFGKKPAEYFRRRNRACTLSYENLSDDPNAWPIADLMSKIEDGYNEGTYSAVYLIYTKFKSAITVTAETQKFLPVDLQSLMTSTNQEASKLGSLLFEPTPEAVFRALIPRIVSSKFRQASLESKASEQGSRMTAMDSATKNANELIGKLTLKYNKLRQTGITSELLDIIGGAEGLK
jgi:F-type H+-transporting ATPase subunit gamma